MAKVKSENTPETRTVKVLDIEGKALHSIELNSEVFGIEPIESLVHETVRWQLARRRQGTHQALTRSMMRGGGKKPFKQKGTGRARAGSIISPVWVGGAVVHGPLPRSYDYRLPKRTRRMALASVLSDKAAGSKIVVLNKLEVEGAKTARLASILKKIGVESQSAVIIAGKDDVAVQRSSHNLPKVVTLNPSSANVYDLLKHEFIVCTEETVRALEERVLEA